MLRKKLNDIMTAIIMVAQILSIIYYMINEPEFFRDSAYALSVCF